MFQVVRVDSRQAEAVEPLGTKRKFWFSDGGRRVLFKAEERGSGDDWAEKVACELCGLLGLPHVRYELAEQYDGPAYVRPGVVCETCAPKPLSLVLGNELLLKRDPAYPAEDKRRHKVSEHTVHAVVEVIGALSPPADAWMAGVPLGIQTALDVFVGYVMLDARIANQDRHHENWAALRDGERTAAGAHVRSWRCLGPKLNGRGKKRTPDNEGPESYRQPLRSAGKFRVLRAGGRHEIASDT